MRAVAHEDERTEMLLGCPSQRVERAATVLMQSQFVRGDPQTDQRPLHLLRLVVTVVVGMAGDNEAADPVVTQQIGSGGDPTRKMFVGPSVPEHRLTAQQDTDAS